MKKMLVALIFCVLNASDGYVPLSQLENSQKVKNNFKNIKKQNLNSYKQYEAVENINSVENYPKETKDIILDDKQSVEDYVDSDQLILQDSQQAYEYNDFHDTSFHIALNYAPSKVKFSGDISDTYDAFNPELTFNIDQHSVVASYLRTKNKFSSSPETFTSNFYTLGYRYNKRLNEYFKARLGIDANFLKLQNSNSLVDYDELFPSLEAAMSNKLLDIATLSYGAGIGANSDDMKLYYNYFFNIESNPEILGGQISVQTGYKENIFKLKNIDKKYRIYGPYVGLKVRF